MPGMNGQQLAEQLAASQAQMKVLYMSGIPHRYERAVEQAEAPVPGLDLLCQAPALADERSGHCLVIVQLAQELPDEGVVHAQEPQELAIGIVEVAEEVTVHQILALALACQESPPLSCAARDGRA